MARICKELLKGNPLSWVTEGIHLGNTISDRYDGMKSDMKLKVAMYLAKSCEQQQEFHFAPTATKFKLNSVYNSDFSGSPLWNLFCRESVMIEIESGFDQQYELFIVKLNICCSYNVCNYI